MRDIFGFTEAEADLAFAMRAGASPTAYAREKAVSPNTAYTHLRRIKEKTGTRRMADLIHRLNEAHIGLRRD